MDSHALSRRIAGSRLAPVAAFPVRLRRVARHDRAVLAESARWLVTSREHHNYTYDLTRRNREHLAWFVVAVTGAPVDRVRGWLDEIEGDTALRRHIETSIATSSRRGLADRTVRYGGRVGWYALIRALKPAHVVESGVDKGLGSCVLAAALLRNAEEGSPGRLTGLDINPDSGYLVTGRYAEVVDLVRDDSLQSIPRLTTPVDLFLHDSNHSAEHEAAELRLVEQKLAPNALLLSDNASETDELVAHAEKTGRQFLFFHELPQRHWFPGDGMGVAWRSRERLA
jgi:predicted O-methyltransferase YrrM